MKTFLKILFWTFWLSLGFVLHGVLISNFGDEDLMPFFCVFVVLWWGTTIVIISALVKWKQYRKTHPALTKEQKQKRKQIEKEREYCNSAEYKKKHFTDVEFENPYFGKGVLVKDSSSENICYTDIKSGLNAGITGILVLSGETTREILQESLEKPHLVLEDASEMIPYI